MTWWRCGDRREVRHYPEPRGRPHGQHRFRPSRSVNLTRFSLFFPEKREFFLENQGLFTFGGTNARAFGGNATFGGMDNTPVLFYSRRIGLQDGQEVPIVAPVGD